MPPKRKLSPEDKARQQIVDSLHSSEIWDEIQHQLDTDELRKFENHWYEAFIQLKEDVPYLEKLQLKDLFTLEILMDRTMRMRRDIMNDIARIEGYIKIEMAKEMAIRDLPQINIWEMQLNGHRAANQDHYKQWETLHQEKQKLHKSMKTTRDQRIKAISEGKESIPGLLRMLEERDIREIEGREMGLMNLAADKELARLRQETVYPDGSRDIPILLPED